MTTPESVLVEKLTHLVEVLEMHAVIMRNALATERAAHEWTRSQLDAVLKAWEQSSRDSGCGKD